MQALTNLARWWLTEKGFVVYGPEDIPPAVGVTLSGPATLAIGTSHEFKVFNPTGVVSLRYGATMVSDPAVAAKVIFGDAPARPAPAPGWDVV